MLYLIISKADYAIRGIMETVVELSHDEQYIYIEIDEETYNSYMSNTSENTLYYNIENGEIIEVIDDYISSLCLDKKVKKENEIFLLEADSSKSYEFQIEKYVNEELSGDDEVKIMTNRGNLSILNAKLKNGVVTFSFTPIDETVLITIEIGIVGNDSLNHSINIQLIPKNS